jgi:hypothetical protein
METQVSGAMDGGGEKKNNTPLIIGIVVAVVLCCCCAAGVGIWQYWPDIAAALGI